MSLYEYDPESEIRSFLPLPGRYGAGQANGGTVECIDFVPSCREMDTRGEAPEQGSGPGYDRKCERDDYARFTFQVQHPTYGLVPILDWQPTRRYSGSKLLPHLRALKVPMLDGTGPDGKPRVSVDFDIVKASLPKSCVIEVGAPRKDKEDPSIFYTGRLIAVLELA